MKHFKGVTFSSKNLLLLYNRLFEACQKVTTLIGPPCSTDLTISDFRLLEVFKGKAYENKLTTTIERLKNDIRQEMGQIEQKTYENSIETTHICNTARSDSTIYR